VSQRPRIAVIGAGIGGLAAAVELAAKGCDVTVLERGSVPGGKMRELCAGDAAIDSGPTVFTMRWVFDELFRSAGTNLDDELSLARADLLARHAWLDGSRLDLHADVERSAAAIEAFAGAGEAAAYRRFAADSEAIYETLADTFMRREKPNPVSLGMSLGIGGLPRLYATKPFRTLWSELGRYFDDPRLRQLFGRYATYTGSSPFSAPATLMLIAHVERAGVYYVEGGMQRLAEALVRIAKNHGAEFRFSTGAAELRTDRGRVTGVLTESGDELPVDAVVFNGDVDAFGRGLLGKAVARAVPSRSKEPRSLSAITWSLVAEADGFPLDHHTVFFGDNYPAEFKALFEASTITDMPTVYVCAQDRENAAVPGGPERLFLLVNAPARPHRERELDAAEARVQALLSRLGLDLDLGAEDVVRFSPDDFAERFPGTGGAIYGWPTHGMMGSFRRHGSRSRVRGLYLAGGSVHPGPGVPMTAISGRIAARAVLGDLGRDG
jgi:1-hydroxycarotenoid 3,4-desaturase